MGRVHNDDLPRELQSTADLLREHRADPSGMELDRLKLRVIKQASSRTGGFIPNRKGALMKRKALSLALATGVLLSTASVGLAVTGNFPGGGGGLDSAIVSAAQSPNASASQYGGTVTCRNVRRTNRSNERALVRKNRADERSTKRSNRATERGLRGSSRRFVVRRNRAAERAQRRRNRAQERSVRRGNRAEERRCTQTGSP